MKKVHQTTDENLQNSAGGFDCFADGQSRFGPDLDADQRAHQRWLDLRCLISGWKQAGGSESYYRLNFHLDQFGSQLDVEQRPAISMELCRFLG